MRWSIVLCAGAGVVSGATSARAEGPYLGIEGGLTFQQPTNYNFIGLQNFFEAKYAKGIDVAGKAGYDFEGIRIEAEIGYKRSKANQFNFSVNGEPLLVVKGAGVSGNLNSFSVMANGYWDITQKKFRPYVGVGAGLMRVSSDRIGYAGFGDTGIFLNKTNNAFAFNLMAGVKARITTRLSANIEYKFSDVEHFRLGVFSAGATTKLRSSAVMFGISFAFGRSIRDTPPPPRPPVLPSAPESEQTYTAPVQTTFNVSFGTASTALHEDANVMLDRIAMAYRVSGHATVMVSNSDVGSGIAPYDEQLAARRAGALKAALIDRGVPPQEVIIQTFEMPTGHPNSATALPTKFIMVAFGIGSGQ